jgi:hypothetical protein
MPGVRTRVDVTNNFAQVTQQVIDTARESVGVGAREGGKAAQTVASQRSKTGRMADIRVSSPSKTYDGFEASFLSPVHYAWFQNYGTLGNRKKALKQSPRKKRTREPGTGVEPLKFLDIGRRVGRKAMLEHIAKGLPK